MAPVEGAQLLTLAVHLHIHLLHHVKGPALDYLGVAIAAFVSWVGLPGPGEPVLIAASVFAAKNKLDIAPVILVAFAAATLGGIVGWLVGLLAGRSALTAPGPLRKARIHAAKRGEQLFRRWEIAAILLTPSWVAGINRARTGVYQLTNVVSAFLWAVALGVGAYYAGPPVLDVFNDTTTIAFVALVAVVVGGVGLELVRRRRRRALRLER